MYIVKTWQSLLLESELKNKYWSVQTIDSEKIKEFND